MRPTSGPGAKPRASTWRPSTQSRGALLAGCGGDFDYKISGDRAINEVRGARAGGGGKTATHEDLMKLQEQYQAKVAGQESGAKK